MDTNSLINLLTPIFATLVTAGIKLLLPKIPKWVIPLICTVAGAAGNVVAHYAETQNQNVTLAILLALAGIGVREIKDQFTPEPAAPPATPPTVKLS